MTKGDEMLLIHKRYELAVDFRQWMIGINYHEGSGWNFFFLCLRFGIYPEDVLPF